MRDIKVFSVDSNTIQSTYDLDEMTRALEDIAANGDIIIFVTDVLKEKYEESRI